MSRMSNKFSSTVVGQYQLMEPLMSIFSVNHSYLFRNDYLQSIFAMAVNLNEAPLLWFVLQYAYIGK